jgi:hypothetical protein
VVWDSNILPAAPAVVIGTNHDDIAITIENQVNLPLHRRAFYLSRSREL